MKLVIYYDLHTEHLIFKPPTDLDADVIILAGEIHPPGHTTPKWARRDSVFSDRPVIYVAGNHEFYLSEYLSQKRLGAKTTQGSRPFRCASSLRADGAKLFPIPHRKMPPEAYRSCSFRARIDSTASPLSVP